ADQRDHELHVFAEQLHRGLAHLLGQGREADQIGEDDGHLAQLAIEADLLGVLQEIIDQGGIDVRAEALLDADAHAGLEEVAGASPPGHVGCIEVVTKSVMLCAAQPMKTTRSLTCSRSEASAALRFSINLAFSAGTPSGRRTFTKV